MKITAPYNFVPLNKEIFYPSWADKVSHDVPFEDGESGEIKLTITAKSPIFIRDSKTPEKENEPYKFSNFEGKYFIPATSVKGAIRSVLEIISFSKLRNEEFNNKTYSVRDMSKSDNFYMMQMKKTRYCGWLKKVEDGYEIEDCGIPGRIHQKQIDELYNIEFSHIFKKGNFDEEDKNKKTSKYKYNQLKGKKLTSTFRFLETDNGREIYIQSKQGDEGTIVFTGQSSARDESGKPSGKIYEFIFFRPKKENKPIKISDQIMENFKVGYFDGRKTEPKESPDWTYWKEKLENEGKVPVFFQKNEEGELLHFGLSYLYKLPYDKTIGAGIHRNNESLQEYKLDLAQTMFGYVDKDKNKALKGRVYFSHFLADENATESKPVSEILGTPRPSYYPNYIKQNGNKLKTYMDDFEISGRKRYPIRKSGVSKTNYDENLKKSDNVKTTFIPLKEGVKFEGKIRFHNLKKAEIGALISAITFHNTKNTFHNIGYAKPYGYGKVEFKITNLTQDEIKEYLSEFEKEILIEIPNWGDLDQNSSLLELLAMASEQNNKDDLKYMDLEDFAKAKTGGLFLKPYTKSDGVSFDTSKFIINLKDDELEKLKQNSKWQKIDKNNKNSIEEFIEKYPQSPYKKDAITKLNELKEIELQEKLKLEEKQIQENWEKISQDKKHTFYKESLEKHIKDFPEHPTSKLAQEELKRLLEESQKLKQKEIKKDPMEILSIRNLDEIRVFLNKLEKVEILDQDKEEIEKHIKSICNDVSKKIKTTFLKKSKLNKIFTKDEIDKFKD